MSTRITLIATAGPITGQEYVFTGHTSCMVGRSFDCQLRLPGEDLASLTASRRHCMLDIEPPLIHVRDLGSRNGTFVNGRKIGQQEEILSPWEPVQAEPAGVELHDHDRLVVGSSEFLIGIETSDIGSAQDSQAKRWDEESPANEGAASDRSCAVCC